MKTYRIKNPYYLTAFYPQDNIYDIGGFIGGVTDKVGGWIKNEGNLSDNQQLVASGISEAVSQPIGKYKRGLLDAADPLYHLAGNNKSVVGEGLSNVGAGIFKSSLQKGNLMGMAVWLPVLSVTTILPL